MVLSAARMNESTKAEPSDGWFPAFERWRQKDQELKVVPSYIVNLRVSPGNRRPYLKTKTNKYPCRNAKNNI